MHRHVRVIFTYPGVHYQQHSKNHHPLSVTDDTQKLYTSIVRSRGCQFFPTGLRCLHKSQMFSINNSHHFEGFNNFNLLHKNQELHDHGSNTIVISHQSIVAQCIHIRQSCCAKCQGITIHYSLIEVHLGHCRNNYGNEVIVFFWSIPRLYHLV